jgi:repressor of nif and glnA expression
MMNTITIIHQSPTAEAFLIALMCRKGKGEAIAAMQLHPWNARETAMQAGAEKERRAA